MILILAEIYADYGKWIKKEIDLAKTESSTPKPIIAVEYWKSQRTSVIVKNKFLSAISSYKRTQISNWRLYEDPQEAVLHVFGAVSLNIG